MMKTWILLEVILFLSTNAGAQMFRLKGLVKDGETLRHLPSVTVYDSLLHKEYVSDSDGTFSILVKPQVSLRLDYVGYRSKVYKGYITSDTTITFLLDPLADQLNQVVVSTKKRKYRNKYNPGVTLIRKIIQHKPENSIDYFTMAEYEQYSKINFYASKFPKWAARSKLLKKYDFILNQKDSTAVLGRKLMPVYMEETVTDRFFRKHPKASGSKVLAFKHVDYGKFIDTRGISVIFNRLFEDVNIYDNSIFLFTKAIASPISDYGPTWYKYFIKDTVRNNGMALIQLDFEPRNNADLLFSGSLFVSMDGRYAVDSLELTVGKGSNLSFLRSFDLYQKFGIDSATKHYYLNYSSLVADFGLYKKITGLVGKKTVSITRFKSNRVIADSLLRSTDDILLRKGDERTDAYWANHRTVPLRKGEADIYTYVDSLRGMKSYQHTMDWINAIGTGYKTFNKFQLGPVTSFIDYNPVEGVKPRIGGRTLPELNKSLYLFGYAAYGTQDRKVKYMGKLAYAFNHKSIYTFPMNAVSVSSSFDVNIPGTPENNEHGNILLSTNNGSFKRYLYYHIFAADYLKEFNNHFAITGGVKLKNQRAGGSLFFIKEPYMGSDSLLDGIRTTELSLGFRWAPHEEFYQNDIERLRVPGKFPVVSLDYAKGASGLFGGRYNYDRLHLNIHKRLYLSILGMSRATIDAGYLFGQVPWPLLLIHQGNQGLGYSSYSFNTMNYMEFVSDHYASMAIAHNFNGLFFNRIPLIKKLKWRELFGVKVLYGGLRKENNPLYTDHLLKFPYESNARTYLLSNQPYVELNFGVGNIFKIGEVTIVKRMTYLDHPGISPWNVKFGIHLSL